MVARPGSLGLFCHLIMMAVTLGERKDLLEVRKNSASGRGEMMTLA